MFESTSLYDDVLHVTLLDTQTGFIACTDVSMFELQENNWSCDCNRRLCFDPDVNMNYDCVSERYIVIFATDNNNKLVDPRTLNICYPDELLEKYFGRM